MARFVDLEVIEGPEQGMRYTVESGTYRVLGRAGDDLGATVRFHADGDRVLDADQQAVVDGLMDARDGKGVRTKFRRRGPDILLHDDSVSRTHALVFVDESGVSVADLMSTNGTKVNGARVGDVDVQAGDVVHIGQSKLRIKPG